MLMKTGRRSALRARPPGSTEEPALNIPPEEQLCGRSCLLLLQ